MNRKEIEQKMLKVTAGVMTPEEHRVFGEKLSRLPDSVFFELVRRSVQEYENNPFGLVEFKKMEREMLKKRGMNASETALGQYSMDWLPEEDAHRWWKEISRSRPSDSISLMGKDDDSLCALWQSSVADKNFIPSDIFFSDGIPLMDCEIVVDERDKLPAEQGGQVVPFRVVIFDDYKEQIEKEDGSPSGALIIPGKTGDLFVLLSPVRGVDSLMISGLGFHGSNMKERLKDVKIADILQGAYACLATWYGLQIALLHPGLKEIFERPKTVPVMSEKKKSKCRKRQTRYIKRHVIRPGEIEETMTEPREFTRHTLAWYVIGHWRHYQSGNRVFIKGYWKGILRDLKRNLDEGRDRIINIPEGGEII